MPHFWKSHVTAHMLFTTSPAGDSFLLFLVGTGRFKYAAVELWDNAEDLPEVPRVTSPLADDVELEAFPPFPGLDMVHQLCDKKRA